MEITYDKEADAMYIELQKGTFAKNKVIDDFIILDLDDKGNTLGIELLHVSEKLPAESLNKIKVNNLLVC